MERPRFQTINPVGTLTWTSPKRAALNWGAREQRSFTSESGNSSHPEMANALVSDQWTKKLRLRTLTAISQDGNH
jgi:hypothetical protein